MLRALMADGGHGDLALAAAVQCRQCSLPLAVSLRTPVLAFTTFAAAFVTPLAAQCWGRRHDRAPTILT
jgi:hypothetical protein